MTKRRKPMSAQARKNISEGMKRARAARKAGVAPAKVGADVHKLIDEVSRSVPGEWNQFEVPVQHHDGAAVTLDFDILAKIILAVWRKL